MQTITDKFGRPLRDLRISVTDRCNFRCTYCMPKEIFGKDYPFLPKDALLSFEEIERLTKIFAALGVKKVRLTGGEPLLRRNLPDLIQKISSISGIEDIGLTTNASLLERMAQDLKNAGLQRVNVSLDALNNDVFQAINDSGVSVQKVLRGIEKAKEIGLKVKVNMVVKKGMNEHEILPMANYFKEKDITLRFIEFMDVGQTNGWDFSKVVTKKELYEKLTSQFALEAVEPAYVGEVAKRYRYKGTNTEVGFITSVSESFCSTCNRARIAADGKLYTCLFAGSGFDFRELLRSSANDNDIEEQICNIWNKREDRYSDERTEETGKNKDKIEMSYIGG
ncbi:GTP 3',8-cyclase MoaA [Ornithinibacillus halophilus]|uniref:GTP 3',8-cyclase n=1 Tax=Ornithinibacillus halophilus TaxID=930117 RepID=A0A1M5FLV5_9BACI|nr:GTP 3',8-cyclase MoaA [Ornithinibacillus halophilus]SHF92409.1 cyclic pyranopterin monophosphate synthase subunit MoaA [Ornithinibacillus halophilus]